MSSPMTRANLSEKSRCPVELLEELGVVMDSGKLLKPLATQWWTPLKNIFVAKNEWRMISVSTAIANQVVGSPTPSMITPNQAAEKLGVSPALVYRWCKEGLLEHYRFGGKGKRGKVMIELSVLDLFIENCRQTARPTGLKHIQLKPRTTSK